MPTDLSPGILIVRSFATAFLGKIAQKQVNAHGCVIFIRIVGMGFRVDSPDTIRIKYIDGLGEGVMMMSEPLKHIPELYATKTIQSADGRDQYIGRFSPASAKEQTVYHVPNQAHISVESTEDRKYADWLREEGIIYMVKQDPPTLRVENPDSFRTRTVPIDDFPPAGTHHIYNDRTAPVNLGELIQQRIDGGWTVDQELIDRLNLNVPTEG